MTFDTGKSVSMKNDPLTWILTRRSGRIRDIYDLVEDAFCQAERPCDPVSVAFFETMSFLDFCDFFDRQAVTGQVDSRHDAFLAGNTN